MRDAPLGLDARERIHRIRLSPTEDSRQHPPQQLSRCPAPHDRRPIIAIADRDIPTGRDRLPRTRAQDFALPMIGAACARTDRINGGRPQLGHVETLVGAHSDALVSCLTLHRHFR